MKFPIKQLCWRPAVAALALAATQAHGATVLHDQTADCIAGVPSFVSDSALGLASEAADDFDVPAGQSWDVTQVYTPGVYSVSFPGTALSMNVQFFADAAGEPGNAIAACTYSGITTFTDSSGTLTTTLPSPCVLQGGISGTTFWVAVQAVTGTGADLGVWYWTSNSVQEGNLSQWENPLLGFNSGCATWGSHTACNLDEMPDQCFSISGEVDAIFADGFGEP